MKLNDNAYTLYAVTDRAWVGKQTLIEQVEAAIKGGATIIQLREKELDEALFEAEALEIKQLCLKYNIPLIINDNVEIAIKCSANGIHIGQDDMPLAKARKLVGDKIIIGVSVGTVNEAVEAEQNGADYIGVGAVFSTSTKADAVNVPIEELKLICRAVSIPVVAIGGINKFNMSELKNTGIKGVALVSAIFSANDIESECRSLKALAKSVIG